MDADARPFYLGIGSIFSETVTSKLTTSGDRYVGKLLQSKPENWAKIVDILGSKDLAGVVVKLGGSDYQRLLTDNYREVAARLFAAVGQVPHLVLVHEAVAGPPLDADLEDEFEEEWSEWASSYDVSGWTDRVARAHFGDMDPTIQAHVHRLMDENGVRITTYKRNAEASILAADFVGDLQDNLIFRIYVPAGRIYEDEIGRLLALFHHWLGAVKGATVRQGGYQTTHGRVIEFYGDGLAPDGGITTELAEFNEFLGLLDDPGSAGGMLLALGVESNRVDDLVSRYARDARRVMLDARHERDRKMLLVMQALESELVDENLPLSPHEVSQLVQSLVPLPTLSLGPQMLPRGPSTGHPAVVINNQIIQRVQGVVAQTLNAEVNYGTPVDDLLKLIHESDTPDRSLLEDAAKQLADPGAPTSTRIAARQRLKAFLFRNVARVEASTYDVVWKWVQAQVGS